MRTGNYDYDNFVRVDCALEPKQIMKTAVHEVAHLTLMKQSYFGLLCFFMSQDAKDVRSPVINSLQVLEQAFEGVNECYARWKELLLCTCFVSDAEQRAALIENQRRQPYFTRYHMERFDSVMAHYDQASMSPLFPDLIFFLAANGDLSSLLSVDLFNVQQVETCILTHRKELYPDYRLKLLLEAFDRLSGQIPPEQINIKTLTVESGLIVAPNTQEHMLGFLRQLEQLFAFRPEMKKLLVLNQKRLEKEGTPTLTSQTLAVSFGLSLTDGVIPFALQSRFRMVEVRAPFFQRERNVLLIALEPETFIPPAVCQKANLKPGPVSAYLYLVDTVAGHCFSNAFVQDMNAMRKVLNLYHGTVYLYLDDYGAYLKENGFCSYPVFFRADVPWIFFREELSKQGLCLKSFFLQKYSDSVIFFFGFDSMENVIFSMFVYWELDKIFASLKDGSISSRSMENGSYYGAHKWWAFRDIIAATTEDVQYAKLDQKDFERLRIF